MNIVLALILFVLEASVLGSPLEHVNKRKIPFEQPEHQVEIIGGGEATPHSIPYQVALVIESAFFCGGVLISTKYVLTAAHCTYGVNNILVILGAHNIAWIEDTQVFLYNPTVICHELFTGNNYNYDISLLKLSRHIPPTAAIKAVPSLAPTDSDNFEGYSGCVSGWGYTTSDGLLQSKLRKVSVEIISNARCRLSMRSAIPASNLCTRGTDEVIGPVGACDGDSGGPLVVGNQLVGLVAFGEATCEGGLPTVYSRISYFREWITKHSGV